MKRLFYDIEVSPNIVLCWRTGYKIDVNYDGIVKERAIICIAWKWEGETEVHALHWDKNQNDRVMLEKFLKVAEEADELVGHYVDHFDTPWVRTRCLYHGLDPIPIYKTIDTKALACKYFLFNSNKLDYIASFLGVGQKIKTDYSLWKEVLLDNSTSSLKKMVDYCKNDVVILEKVFGRLKSFAPSKTHVGVMEGGSKWSCPNDGSENVYKNKTRTTAAGTVQHQMHCRDCGHYYTISSLTHQQYLDR